MDGSQVFLKGQVDEVVGGGSAFSVQLRDLLYQAEGGKPSGKVGCGENQLLPVQYTFIGHSTQVLELLVHICAGPAPTILDWYGHCMRLSVNKLGRCGGMLPHKNFLN